MLHFPIAFPEVFLRSRPGFDVILGNPPWQEATVEEHAFWARNFPGLRSLPQREQEAAKERFRETRPDLVSAYETELAEMDRVREALVGGAYPGMGTGDPDLYKAFCWRFLALDNSQRWPHRGCLAAKRTRRQGLYPVSPDDVCRFREC